MNNDKSLKKLNLLRWNLTNKCNYRCSYCITFPVRNFITQQNISNLDFVDRFCKILSGKWNISLEGLGEPFCAPNFFEIIENLSKHNFYISIETNFSYPYSDIEKFIQYAGNNLLNIGATLHLEHVDPNSFLKKIFYFSKIIPGRIFVKYVATKKGMILLDQISRNLRKHNISLLVLAERMVSKRGLEHARSYSEKELDKIMRSTSTFWLDQSFVGKLCWSGCKHFVVQENGNAFR